MTGNMLDDGIAILQKQILKHKHILLFLDYDGTLAPFDDDPDKAVPLYGIENLLENMSRDDNIEICIISGRSLKSLNQLIDLNDLYYAGIHGLEITLPDGRRIFPTSQNDRLELSLKNLKKRLKLDWGNENCLKIEDKGPVLTIHYPPEMDSEKLYSYIKENINPEHFQLMKGRQIIEVRPWGWNKGKAVQLLINNITEEKKLKDYLVIYIGDDSTDEDAFRVLKDNTRALTVYVSNDSNLDTAADFYLEDPHGVKDMLVKIKDIL